MSCFVPFFCLLRFYEENNFAQEYRGVFFILGGSIVHVIKHPALSFLEKLAIENKYIYKQGQLF